MALNLPRPRFRYTAVYRFSPRLQAGYEYNPNARETNLIGNYILMTESERNPMISVGTSSDRIGTPAGPRATYVTFAKSVPHTRFSGYFSLNYSEFEDGFNLPFGLTYGLAPKVSTMFMNDGRKSHWLLTHSEEDWSVSAMLVWMKHPGISVSFGF